ncbi:hypothetical protein EJB05_28385 [Eragrostis curvula]|uniref:Uncharacterized protein n=1 Tax=Eragrostis curvula TaxID=38414 RepID=A0A5J9URG4_9POAL|nr:hypothetical protein EJB05_28385 [Eragrostis curvula]
MASFAAQLKDMFFVLIERVTGYGRAEEKHAAAGAQEPQKLASVEASRTEQVVLVKHTEMRARGTDMNFPDDVPNVSRGSLPQVHTRNL